MSFAETGATPLFAAQWALTEIDGMRAADADALSPGAEWSWRGPLFRLDMGADPQRGPLRLEGAIGREALRRVAAHRAARVGRRVRPGSVVREGAVLGGSNSGMGPPRPSDCAAFRRSFTVTDGRRAWAVARAVDASGGGPDLVLFAGDVPPADTRLWIVTVSAGPSRDTEVRLPTLAGFGVGTQVETPFGPVAVEHLRPGDPVLTDRGTAPLRRVRLRPGGAALRLEAHMLGEAGPPNPVTLGAGTLIAVEGRRLGALFGAGDGSSDPLEEALVRVSDLAMLPGASAVRSADLIAFETDCHAEGAALVMAGGLAALAGPEARAGMRCLTHAEAQVLLVSEAAGIAPWRILRARAA